jgi:hypothetical protein
MTSTYKLLADFIKQPYNEITETSWQQKIKLFGKVVFFYIKVVLLLLICIGVPIGILKNVFEFEIVNFAKPQYLNDFFCRNTLLLMVGVIAPIVEECMFRLSLSFKKRDIILSVAVILGVIIYNFFDNNYIILSIIVLFGLFGLYLVAQLKQDVFNKMKDLCGKYILYFSILLFTIAHLTNFGNFEINLLPIYLLLLLPTFLAGFIATFIRLKISFIFAILFHSLINTSLLFLVANR